MQWSGRDGARKTWIVEKLASWTISLLSPPFLSGIDTPGGKHNAHPLLICPFSDNIRSALEDGGWSVVGFNTTSSHEHKPVWMLF